MSRDDFCRALQTLYSSDPHDYDGLTLADISQTVTPQELHQVFVYLGLEAAYA